MRFTTLFVMSVLSVACAQAQSNTYAVTHVSLIPMDREIILPDQTLIIENGRIKTIGSTASVRIPAGCVVMNGTGKFLMPGLFDMHAHFFYEQGENKNTCEQELKLMLANGLTTVRIECGDSVYLEAKKKVKTGQWQGPDLLIASPQFVGAWPWPPPVFAAICKTPTEAEAAVRRFKREGYDEIKITFMVKRDVYDAIINTAREVGIKVTGHVGPLVKLPAALAAKEQIEHMDEFIDMLLPDSSYNHGQSVSDMNVWRKKAWETVPFLDENKIPALVDMVRKSGIYVTPTNYFFLSCFGEGMTNEEYKSRPDYNYIPAVIKKERWAIKDRYWNNAPPEASRKKYVALRKKMTLELWRAGVPLMAGSDSPEWFLVTGFSIHDEIETFVKAGLSPFAALQTATVVPAQYLGLAQERGTVKEGLAADLIMLDRNPLEDITNTRSINTVFHSGKVFSKESVANILEETKGIGN